MTVRVLVCGGRTWGVNVEGMRPVEARSEWDFLFRTLDDLHKNDPIDTLIHGGAPGADHVASLWSISRGASCPGRRTYRVEADWVSFGKAAGPIRNQRMLDDHKPDLVVAFPGGAGTADMVRRARKAGVDVWEPTP